MTFPPRTPRATPAPSAPRAEAVAAQWPDAEAAAPEARPGPPAAAAPASMTVPPAVRRPHLFGLCWLLLLLTFPAVLMVGLLVASAASAIVWVGLVLWLGVMAGVRIVVDGYRALAGRVLGERIATVYRPIPPGTLFQRLSAALTDPARWRDIGYLFFAITLGFVLIASSLVAFVIFPLGYWLSPMLLRLWASATKGIVGPASEALLQERIGRLEESRSETVDHTAAELRRIERDLHDGAQAQLVAVALNLGLAEEMVGSDPAGAARLIADARSSSQTALADLRSLVRGIHPPVLADRGLPGAIDALALAHPWEVTVDVDLPGRPPAPVESAVYFAIAESLANSAKHAAAQTVWISVWHEFGSLTALIGDDGAGGAVVTPGGGLDGIVRRLDAFDGTMTVASPPGGPTIVSVTVPCALGAGRPGRGAAGK